MIINVAFLYIGRAADMPPEHSNSSASGNLLKTNDRVREPGQQRDLSDALSDRPDAHTMQAPDAPQPPTAHTKGLQAHNPDQGSSGDAEMQTKGPQEMDPQEADRGIKAVAAAMSPCRS